VTSDFRGVSPTSPNPLVNTRYYVNHIDAPWKAYRRARGHDRVLLGRIATQPWFRWFGTWTKSVRHDVRGYINRAWNTQRAVPQIVTMEHIHKNPCHGRRYDGGARADRKFVRWMKALARAIGRKRVIVAFEPDSLGTLNCSSRSRRRARLRMYRRGVDVLAKAPGATIYLEAGSAEWKSSKTMASRLRAIGISKVRGFMLNVTHHGSNSRNYRFGAALSQRLGGKPFVISTTTNGRPGNVRGWCKPSHQGAGVRPTVNTGHALLDAYLWIDRPGYAGGGCKGSPGSGKFWRTQALRLGANAVP
jgi:endoglucanase